MTGLLLFGGFALLLAGGVPIAAALGLSGALAIWASGQPLVAVPTNAYAGIAKYPLIAIPMFVLVGCVFERAGVAARLMRLAQAVVGAGRGALAAVTVLVALVLGGISGSGPASAAALGQVARQGMEADGYPRPFIAGTVASAAATDILIPPSIAFIVYAVLVPGVSVPAIFLAGLVPGLLAGLCLIGAILLLSWLHGFGGRAAEPGMLRLRRAFLEALPALAAPVLILGGMRLGVFTPTEAAVVAVLYGLFLGFVVHRSLDARGLWDALCEAGMISAAVLIVIGLASVFAYAAATLGLVQPVAGALLGLGLGEAGTLLLLLLALVLLGMVLDGVSIFLIALPVLLPIALAFGWDLTWFGVVLTMMVAVGQITPPMAVNLLVACRVVDTSIESTLRWVPWLVLALLLALALVVAWPGLALWLPRAAGLLG